MIFVANKKRSLERIQRDYPGATILDITSSSSLHSGQILSPFYPHRNIPIPGESLGMTATCVEAIWQGLKVFEGAGIDIQMFRNDTMKNIKRTVRKYGKPLGHQYGVFSSRILNYAEAKRLIYIPTYRWVLDNVPEVHRVVERIAEKAKESDIVLLDYNLNPDNRDITKPLSHAELVKMYIEGRYPSQNEDSVPSPNEEGLSQKQTVKKPVNNRKKVETPEDEKEAIDIITELLQTEERSAREITNLLRLDIKTKDLQKLIERIPGINTRTEKRTKFYTIGKQHTEPTLF